MRNKIIIVCLVFVMLALVPATQAEDFNLTGTQHKDVTTSYRYGDLYGSSSVDVLQGGIVNSLSAYDNSTVNMTGGSISELGAQGTSTINISDGGVNNALYAVDTSTVIISGGNVNRLYVKELRFNGPERVNITGGSIGVLEADITLSGSEHFSFAGSLSDIASYGVQSSGGTVGVLALYLVTALNDSTMSISNGNIYLLGAFGNSRISISGGDLDTFEALDNSTLDFSGGKVNTIRAIDTSTINIYGGSFNELFPGNNSIVNISGGHVDTFFAGNNGICYSGGCSTVNISGGSVCMLDVCGDTIINISGGSVNKLNADTGTVIFDGYDFVLGSGLSWNIDGETILGTGILTGKWFDGTSWSTNISYQDTTTTIMAIPEPATLALLSFGVLVLRKKMQNKN